MTLPPSYMEIFDTSNDSDNDKFFFVKESESSDVIKFSYNYTFIINILDQFYRKVDYHDNTYLCKIFLSDYSNFLSFTETNTKKIYTYFADDSFSHFFDVIIKEYKNFDFLLLQESLDKTNKSKFNIIQNNIITYINYLVQLKDIIVSDFSPNTSTHNKYVDEKIFNDISEIFVLLISNTKCFMKNFDKTNSKYMNTTPLLFYDNLKITLATLKVELKNLFNGCSKHTIYFSIVPKIIKIKTDLILTYETRYVKNYLNELQTSLDYFFSNELAFSNDKYAKFFYHCTYYDIINSNEHKKELIVFYHNAFFYLISKHYINEYRATLLSYLVPGKLSDPQSTKELDTAKEILKKNDSRYDYTAIQYAAFIHYLIESNNEKFIQGTSHFEKFKIKFNIPHSAKSLYNKYTTDVKKHNKHLHKKNMYIIAKLFEKYKIPLPKIYENDLGSILTDYE